MDFYIHISIMIFTTLDYLYSPFFMPIFTYSLLPDNYVLNIVCLKVTSSQYLCSVQELFTHIHILLILMCKLGGRLYSPSLIFTVIYIHCL